MKESKIILLVFLACFSISIPIEVSGQSMVIIGRDSFEMYPDPLKTKQILHDKVYGRIPEGDYIRDITPYVAWWRLQNDSLFLEKIVDCYSTIRSDDHKTVFMNLEGIFDAYLQDGKIFASWYSGELDVTGGECIYQAAMGFRSDYEDQRIYRVENGRVVSKTIHRNERREAALSGNIVSLIEILFNGDRFPELADKYMIAKVQVIPRPDGSIDSLGLAVRMVPDKSSISQVRDDDGQWIENDFSNSYIQELKECVLLVPAWDYVKLCGQVHPMPGCELRVWEGKGCKNTYPNSSWNWEFSDMLSMDGDTYKLKNTPLQYDMNLYARMRSLLREEFIPLCLRGYTAHWEIRGGKLFLTSIQGAKSRQVIPLDVIFPGNNGSPVEAKWYTGELYLLTKNSLENNNSIQRNDNEEIVCHIKKGKLKQKRIERQINNLTKRAQRVTPRHDPIAPSPQLFP